MFSVQKRGQYERGSVQFAAMSVRASDVTYRQAQRRIPAALLHTKRVMHRKWRRGIRSDANRTTKSRAPNYRLQRAREFATVGLCAAVSVLSTHAYISANIIFHVRAATGRCGSPSGWLPGSKASQNSEVYTHTHTDDDRQSTSWCTTADRRLFVCVCVRAHEVRPYQSV